MSNVGIVKEVEEKFRLCVNPVEKDGSISHNESIVVNAFKKETEQTNLVIGFKAPSVTNQDEKYIAKVLVKVLGGSMSSRMFSEIREKRGLAYHVSTSHLAYKNTGMIVTKAGVANEKVEEASEAILSEHMRLILDIDNKEIGLVADNLTDVVTIKDNTITLPDDTTPFADFLSGIIEFSYSPQLLSIFSRYFKRNISFFLSLKFNPRFWVCFEIVIPCWVIFIAEIRYKCTL